jgi:hypoxanthine-guanine phosphoribosyltransferase
MRYVVCCGSVPPLQVVWNRLRRRDVNQMKIISLVSKEVRRCADVIPRYLLPLLSVEGVE